jgi:hypothetical protein
MALVLKLTSSDWKFVPDLVTNYKCGPDVGPTRAVRLLRIRVSTTPYTYLLYLNDISPHLQVPYSTFSGTLKRFSTT